LTIYIIYVIIYLWRKLHMCTYLFLANIFTIIIYLH